MRDQRLRVGQRSSILYVWSFWFLWFDDRNYETEQINRLRHASLLSDSAYRLRFLHAHELARVDQVISGAEMHLKQQMLQRRNPCRHLREHNINLLSQVLKPAAQP